MSSRPSGPRRAAPQLSVVVPVYNVQTYLADCLDSLLAQTFEDFEVVIVDDGSTDSSAAIAAGYVRDHAEISLVRTANRGLGAARNRGVAESRGEFLAFLDSDDLLPPHAYQLMVSTLRQSGSDFVVGSLEQLAGGLRVEPPWIARAHQQRRIGIRLAEFPPIMQNVFAWDKVFRRSFYDRIGLTFPEGVRYEDQVSMTEAYVRADAFDIVRRPVYVWRIRDDMSSITQRRHELADLDDRIVTKQLTTEVLLRFGSPDLLDFWAKHGLVGDLPLYFREVPNADDAYWQRLATGTRGLFEGLPPIQQSVLRVGMRLVGWLVCENRRADAETVIGWLQEHPGPLSLTVEDDHVVAALPLCGDPEAAIPPEVCWLGDHELEHDARLVDAYWDGPHLVLTGWGLIRGAPTTGVEVGIGVALSGGPAGTSNRVDAVVEQFAAPEATMWVSRANQVYDDSGFTARLDVRAYLDQVAALDRQVDGPRADGSGEILVEVRVGGIRRTGRFRTKQPGTDLQRLADRTHPARVGFTPSEGLRVEAWPGSVGR